MGRAAAPKGGGTSSGRHAQTYDTRVQPKIYSLADLAAARATCRLSAGGRRAPLTDRPAAARNPRRTPGCTRRCGSQRADGLYLQIEVFCYLLT